MKTRKYNLSIPLLGTSSKGWNQYVEGISALLCLSYNPRSENDLCVHQLKTINKESRILMHYGMLLLIHKKYEILYLKQCEWNQMPLSKINQVQNDM
jgi:hypothetical protein